MAPKHQTPRGTRDLLPEEIGRWQWAEARARDVLGRYGYREIRTPMFEDYELFARTSGESSDVVQKEMYRLTDLGGRELALRPEGTAPVCRAWLQHGLASRGRIQRLWYLGPMFRYGRPQKGRFRQFHQVGAEIIGTDAPGADVEMIALFVDVFDAWGFHDLTVKMNSVGTPETRAAYGATLRRWLAPAHDRLSEDSKKRLETNPLRVLDSKDPGDLAVLADATLGPPPRMLDALDGEGRAHFEAVRAGLESCGIATEIDHGLVRGLDYYTRTAFEVHDPSLGAQSALGGGGRYDRLIEDLGGPATPAIGFSIGLDRVILALEERGALEARPIARVAVVAMETTRAAVPALVRTLRREFAVDCDLEMRSFGAQMKSAGKSGARLLVILGDDEWTRGEVTLKDLASGRQEIVPRDDLAAALRERLAQDPQEASAT
jgi:histidyl-tRNA synthetase